MRKTFRGFYSYGAPSTLVFRFQKFANCLFSSVMKARRVLRARPIASQGQHGS